MISPCSRGAGACAPRLLGRPPSQDLTELPDRDDRGRLLFAENDVVVSLQAIPEQEGAEGVPFRDRIPCIVDAQNTILDAEGVRQPCERPLGIHGRASPLPIGPRQTGRC